MALGVDLGRRAMTKSRIKKSRKRAMLRGANCIDNRAECAQMLSQSWREYVSFRPRRLILAEREKAVAEFRAQLAKQATDTKPEERP